MTLRFPLAKASLSALMAATTLAGGLAAPAAALAQPAYDTPPSSAYYDYHACQQDKTNRQVAGGILGAVGGAVIGSNLAHGGGRTGGALIGGAVGAAGGAAIGGATANCDNPPPAPYVAAGGPPPAYDDRYDDDRYSYGGGYDYSDSYRRCAMVEDRVFFPDGSVQRNHVRACQDTSGRWYVAE
jgi:hypothetical protein